MMKSKIALLTFSILLLMMFSCDQNSANKNDYGDSTARQADMEFTGTPISFDLQQILDRDTLIAITG